jgi:hypothetical protein
MYLRLKASMEIGDYSATFSQSGGTIGRSTDCTLTLPDPERLVSRVHAEISYSKGRYFIRDLSINGVYLNGSDSPIGRGNSAELHNGDRISIGKLTLFAETSRIPFDNRPPRVVIRYDVESPNQHDDWERLLDDDLEDLDLAEPDEAPSPVVEPIPEATQPSADLFDDPFDSDDVQIDPDTGFPPPDFTPQRPKRIDIVDFAVFGPEALAPGHRHIIDVWAYAAGDLETVKTLAAEVNRDHVFGRKAGLPVYHEAVIKLTLSMPGVDIADPSDIIIWHGDPTNASFAVAVPADTMESELIGIVQLSIDGVPFGKITFVAPLLDVDTGPTKDYERTFACIRAAFASYASAERAEVLGRLQGMRAVCPDLDVFLDVLSLRAGDDWESRLREEVSTRDAFYLFWSTAASSSEWVAREWRMALDQRGIDYIVPVPLQDPRDAPPPSELSRLHFNDAYLDHIAYLRQRQESE